MSGVFLSYSRADRELAEQVVNGLRRIGVEVWWDQDMPGVEWQQELEREINTLAAVVVVWTQNSANSNYVRDEARLALHGGKLVNALSGVHSPPFPYDRVNGLPLDSWNGHDPHNGWTRLVGTVANLVVKAGGAQEGEIQAALAKSEQDVREKQQAGSQAQDAFQEAQAHETDAGEVAKVAREAYERAEEQLQRVGEMRASATILGAAQRELETTRTARDEADAAHRAAKAALSAASRALTRAKADLDSLLGTVSDPVKPKAKAAPRKPKPADPAAPAGDAPAIDAAVSDRGASDPAEAAVAAAAAAGAAADQIALDTEPPVSPPPPASPPPPPPPPPPPSPPAVASPPPPPTYQPYAPTPRTRTPLTSGERTLIAVGVIGGVLVLLVVVVVLIMMASNIHPKPSDNTVVDTNAPVDANTVAPASNTTVAGGTGDVSNSATAPNSGPALSPASSGAQPSASFQVTACNRSAEVLGVAVSYLPVGEPTYWKYDGFFTLQPNSCEKLFTTGNQTFYMRAESSNNSWGDGISLCIKHPGPYDFSIKSGDPCPDGGEPASYSPITNSSGQDYTWNFDP